MKMDWKRSLGFSVALTLSAVTLTGASSLGTCSSSCGSVEGLTPSQCCSGFESGGHYCIGYLWYPDEGPESTVCLA